MDKAPTPPAEHAPLTEVRQTIAKTAAIARRDADADAVTLIAVSKKHGPERIVPLLDAGHRVFGENRVQEAQDKWPDLRERYAGVGGDVELHLVGQLQSNKAEDAVALFDCIHSLDRPSLLKALAKAMDASGRRIPCFIQVNVGDEDQKGGVALEALPDFIAKVRAKCVPIAGLMCLPPADIEPAPFFALLAKLAGEHGFTGLSMGMSGDYPTAIMLGATHVRVGTALFGQREE